jgi:energy-coupling factor transporter transmembrane protein EcfT
MVLAGLALVGGATIPSLPGVLAIYVGLCATAAFGLILPAFLRASLRAILPFLVSLLAIQGLFHPGEDILLAVGPLAVKAEGLRFALLFSARLLVGMGSALLLLLTTRLDHVMLALTQRGLSLQIAYIVVTALQIVPRFQVRAQTIVDAQRSRGLQTRGSLGRRARALPALITPLLLSSLLESDERAIALEIRGFRRAGPKTSWLHLKDTAPQRALRLVCAVAAVVLILLRLRQALPML